MALVRNDFPSSSDGCSNSSAKVWSTVVFFSWHSRRALTFQLASSSARRLHTSHSLSHTNLTTQYSTLPSGIGGQQWRSDGRSAHCRRWPSSCPTTRYSVVQGPSAANDIPQVQLRASTDARATPASRACTCWPVRIKHIVMFPFCRRSPYLELTLNKPPFLEVIKGENIITVVLCRRDFLPFVSP